MKVFLDGGGGGLSRLISLRRAGEVGEQAETQPIELIGGRLVRLMSMKRIHNLYLLICKSKAYIFL